MVGEEGGRGEKDAKESVGRKMRMEEERGGECGDGGIRIGRCKIGKKKDRKKGTMCDGDK